jgi:hypothetical protein
MGHRNRCRPRHSPRRSLERLRHSGCSVIARPDGTAAATGKFLEPDLVIFDIPPAA